MIYVKLKDAGDRYETPLIHTNPAKLGKTEEELLVDGVLVESLPINGANKNQVATLYATKPDKELYYEYTDALPTENEEIEALRNDMNEAVMELSMLIAMGGLE